MTAEGLLLRETAKASLWVDYVKWSLDISAANMQGRNPFLQPTRTPLLHLYSMEVFCFVLFCVCLFFKTTILTTKIQKIVRSAEPPVPTPAPVVLPSQDLSLSGIGNGPTPTTPAAAGGWGAYWDYVKSYVSTQPTQTKMELPPVEEYYDVITFKQLVGVLVAVFVAKKHSKFVSEIQSQIVTTGILGVMVRTGGEMHFLV